MSRISKAFIIAIVILITLISTPAGVLALNTDSEIGASNTGSDEILVKFKANVSSNVESQIHQLMGGRVKEIIPSIGVEVVTVPPGQAKEKIKGYKGHDEVIYAESNSLVEASETPNDTYWDKQWNLVKVQAPEAWNFTHGSPNINIAILDTGIDSSHPDLANKITKIINFTSSPNAEDGYGHGSHVAGIATAATNNLTGVAGLGFDSSIFNVKVLGDNGFGYDSWVAQGIVWATDNGAQVINLSLGDTAASQVMEEAVNYAWNNGVVVVAAAGNSGTSSPFYPAYSENCIAVAATDASDNLASWSNYGDWVDLTAPGVSIYSTVRGGNYGYRSGTSMASPHVAGLASLLATLLPDSNSNGRINDEVRDRLENTVDTISSVGTGKGRINAFKAVDGLQPPLSGTVYGQVMDFATGLPLEGVTVSGANNSTLTDSNGDYSIFGLPTGTYSFTASKSGHGDALSNVEVVAGKNTLVNFTLNDPILEDVWVSKINFTKKGKTLTVSPIIITDKGGLAGTQVSFDIVFLTQNWSCQGITDNSGVTSFEIRNAQSGTYTVIVTSLTANNYTWNMSKGIISASYTITTKGRSKKW